MAYSEKTPNYKLPQWEAGDKPSRLDYNEAFAELDAQLGKKVNNPTTLSNISDLNTITSPGMYYKAGGIPIANQPMGSVCYSLFVEAHNRGLNGVKQTFTDFASVNTYIRTFVNSAGGSPSGDWTDWKELAFK